MDTQAALEAFLAARDAWESRNPLRSLRMQLGATQKDFAERVLQTSIPTMLRWETKLPSDERIAHIAQVTGQDPVEFTNAYKVWYAERPDFTDFVS